MSVENKEGSTPLHDAAGQGHKEVVELLIGAGASLSVENKEGSTPLHVAAREDHKDVLKLLLSEGASLSVVDEQIIKPSVNLRN